jgi:anti-anti-sigma factor
MQDIQTVIELRLTEEVMTAASLRIVYQCLEEVDAPVFHLDLGGVRLPTAAGLGALVSLNQELRARGGALVLINLTAAVYEVFTVTHLVEFLDVWAI